MENYHTVLEAITSSQKQGILAIIVHVEGSAYQKEGACMWIDEEGYITGLISGGCLEEALSIQAQEIWQSQRPTIATFDLKQEDDLSWGQGVGCNGTIHLLLLPITEQLRADLLTVKRHLEQNQHVLMAKKWGEAATDENSWLFLAENGQRWGNVEYEIPADLLNQLHAVGTFQTKNGIFTISGASFYLQHFWPKPRLIIFGANHDVKPLVSFAKQTGFSVTVVDWRPALCCPEQIPDADQWMVGFPKEAIPQLRLCERDFVVIMTHQFQRDQELVSLLSQQPLFYCGILGPKRRTARLFPDFSIPDGIHSPIGLSIGARGPEEIAISILAEMIHVLRKQPSPEGGIR
ncbi:xanthine dehydrogenase [Anoxybacillus sp. UARK-01]|uniref:XdhC family protein n=1 Tax=Anoxybacillus sp. UARK-01 TaxID=1895648 RepID=UPI0009BAAB16|nr:XdhC/CoxI family protein [Anoxybacillus sp. UARK-01]OQM47330.1 xanthine dehydrogenase [Anoxybacillus sp. UARK-01]